MHVFQVGNLIADSKGAIHVVLKLGATKGRIFVARGSDGKQFWTFERHYKLHCA